jgi:hypothetical protein
MTEPRAGLKRGYYLLNTDGCAQPTVACAGPAGAATPTARSATTAAITNVTPGAAHRFRLTFPA